ncbi:hypothetical protein GCM10022240_23640 [Microbacterium kribbense]|uniref:Helix-hairpin-helix DNA-binding motif class 1 domain-containing protein n=1 Tax=Microbacterium kribbense TaxID=433645 RepID=A0ABP7GP97_9MICO
MVVVLAALAVTVAIGMFRGATAPTEVVTIQKTAGATPAGGQTYVHVSGAVRAPGLYLLAPGARVMDAVAAADGFADDAARDGVNLARPVADGEQLVVPRIGDQATAPASPGASADGRINLNTADEAALDTLPRIGPAMAQRILQWRAENGRFTSVEDLLAVPGIGEKMLQTLRDLVTV